MTRAVASFFFYVEGTVVDPERWLRRLHELGDFWKFWCKLKFNEDLDFNSFGIISLPNSDPKKYFDAVARAWCGQKAYLPNYLRLPLEERQKLYLKVMPRLTIFSREQPKTEDRLRGRLKQRGLSDELIDRGLGGLDLK